MIWRIAIAFLVPSGRVVTSSCLTYCKCTRSDDTVSSCPDVSRIKSPTHKTLSVFTNDDHVDLLAVLTRHLSDSIDRPIQPFARKRSSDHFRPWFWACNSPKQQVGCWRRGPGAFAKQRSGSSILPPCWRATRQRRTLLRHIPLS